MQRRHVHYAGRVQGVGFRYTTQRLAAAYEVTGFVRNLADGRVELVLEGRREEITALLDDIDRQLGHYVRGKQVEQLPASGEFAEFGIRF